MAQTPEGKVKGWLKRRIEETFPDVYAYAPPGGMFGNGGAPDRLYLWKGVFFAIEVKATADGEPSKLQLKHLRHIARQGGVAAVIKDRDEARFQQIVAAVMAKAKHDT